VFGGLLGHGDAFVCRDRCGIRPCYYVSNDEYFAAASERAALVNVFGVTPDEIEELTPGHCIVIKRDGRIIAAPFVDETQLAVTEPTPCSFERIYFSRGNDSQIYQERKALGRMLAKRVLDLVDWDVENTVFSYIPNTSETAFLGLVQESERLLQERQSEEAVRLLERGAATVEGIRPIFARHLRVEKVAHKDQKLRTFITDDEHRGTLVAHAYDVTPGVVKSTDTLVVMDDSIVRGTTLRDSVIHMLAGLDPRRIVVVSSAPPIKYPDCYGIDMSELRKFVAFQAAMEILRARGDEALLEDVYQACLAQRDAPLGRHRNHVERIYEAISDEELSGQIARIVRPVDVEWSGELLVMYQTVDALHASIPAHQGDWYFTGKYPTPGGYKVLNTSYIYAHEGRSGRAYVNRRPSRERGAGVPTEQG
jgi:amidophosphoribosyltransferase